MCLSLFFAQIIGLYLLAISLASLIHQNRVRQIIKEILANPAFLATIGCKSLLIGLVILIPHDLWVCQWPILITLIGWIMTFRGLMILFFPKIMIKFFRGFMENSGFMFFSWVWFLIALYLTWIGFTAI